MKQCKLFWIILCLLASLMLTACHTDNDPWPMDGVLSAPTATPAVTQVPQATETMTPRTFLTQEPVVYLTPDPTEIPGGDEAPGLNG